MAIYRKLTVANKSIIHIDYTKGSNAQNIEFEFVDYTIPVGARAFFYVRKPSGLIVYNQEEISGQKVIVKPTLQMTAEGGTNGATLAIMDGKKVLASFPIVFEIAQSYIDPEAVESANEFDLVTQEVADAIAAAERAAGSVTAAAAEAERAAGSVTEAAAEAKKAAGYSTQAQEQADRAEAAANESAGAATAAIEARLGTKEDGTYIKADNSVAQDLKELDGGLASVNQNLTQEITNRTNAVNSKADKSLTNYETKHWAQAVSECSEIIVIGYTGDTPVYVSVTIPTYILSDQYIYFNTQTTVSNKRYIIQVKCNKTNLVLDETKIYIDGVANEFANWWILGRK